MNVSGIYVKALLELDEDLGDLIDYEQKFRMYLNMGYQIALRQYYKPRESFCIKVNEQGIADLSGLAIERVVEMKDENGRFVSFEVCADGCSMFRTSVRNEMVTAVCEVQYPELLKDSDIPKLPEYAHYALVYYICYRHLSSGNLAKQSRAQYYRQTFYEAMNALRPVAQGSVTKYINLYSATDI